MSRTPRTVVLPGDRDPRVERNLVAGALLIAILLHGAVVLLPLRFEHDLPAPLPPRPDPPMVGGVDLIPPPLPELPTMPPPRERPTPVPFPVPDVEPVLEPLPEPELPQAPGPEETVTPLIGPPVAPPAPAGPVDELTPGLVRPQPLERPTPDYPRVAVLAGRSGTVVLRAVIEADGSVSRIRVVRAPDPDLGFSEAALAAVARWTYEPGRLDGRPVPVFMTVYVEFTID